MPILSPKRQVTLPKELCDNLKLTPGDALLIFEHNGRITIVKKKKGSSAGVLRHLKAVETVSVEESLLEAVAEKHVHHRRRRA